MQHQVNVDDSGNPVYINLEFSNGNLLIKDHERNLIKKTVGNPSQLGNPNNIPFTDINEAYEWFLTTSLSNRIDLQEGEQV